MNDNIKEWITVNHQHVPIKEGENKRSVISKVIQRFKKRKQSNNKIDDKLKKPASSEDMKKFAGTVAKNREEIIKKYGKEKFDKEKVGQKIAKKEGLTAKEYVGYAMSGPEPGSKVEGFNQEARLASDGKVVKADRYEAYERNPKANRDAILREKDKLKTAGEREAEKEFARLRREYNARQKEKTSYEQYKEALAKRDRFDTNEADRKKYNETISKYEAKDRENIEKQGQRIKEQEREKELRRRGLSKEEIAKGYTRPYQEESKKIENFREKKQSNVGNGKYSVDYWKKKNVEIKDEAPKGYIKLQGATTAPNGYEWYSNGKSRFSKEYKHILVKENKSNNVNYSKIQVGDTFQQKINNATYNIEVTKKNKDNYTIQATSMVENGKKTNLFGPTWISTLVEKKDKNTPRGYVDIEQIQNYKKKKGK